MESKEDDGGKAKSWRKISLPLTHFLSRATSFRGKASLRRLKTYHSSGLEDEDSGKRTPEGSQRTESSRSDSSIGGSASLDSLLESKSRSAEASSPAAARNPASNPETPKQRLGGRKNQDSCRQFLCDDRSTRSVTDNPQQRNTSRLNRQISEPAPLRSQDSSTAVHASRNAEKSGFGTRGKFEFDLNSALILELKEKQKQFSTMLHLSPRTDRRKLSNEPVASRNSPSPEPDQESTRKHSGIRDPNQLLAELLNKRQCALRELLNTERDYVRDLGQIVEGYMTAMGLISSSEALSDSSCPPMPDDLRNGKNKMIFGNVEVIYTWHNEVFLPALEKTGDRVCELGPLFKHYERKLHMYVVYCQNKPKSEFIISDYMDTYFEELRQWLGHRLTIGDLLIKPVQRITKYQLLLRDLLRHTEKSLNLLSGSESLTTENQTLKESLTKEADHLKIAVQLMTVVPKMADDMMTVGRIQGFEGKLTALGNLLLHGPLYVSSDPKLPCKDYKECQVFLFDQSIIFTDIAGSRTRFAQPVFIFRTQFQTNKISLEERSSSSANEPEAFVIRSTDPKILRSSNSAPTAYVCHAVSNESTRQWIATVKKILQSQNEFLKALQSPIQYQNQQQARAKLAYSKVVQSS